ncbi:MAG: hypothetical protein ISR80_04490 [Nitrosopumilus sp.]|nr:hypothetical protein [Nitrosopumilus sp.]
MPFPSRKPQKLASTSLLNYEEPQIIFYTGMRGSGKGVAVDKSAEDLYREGINIWHLWGARSFENLYWAINKNCGAKHDNFKKVIMCFFDRKQRELNIDSVDIGLNPDELKQCLLDMELEKLIKILTGDNQIRILDKAGDFVNGELLYCKCKRAYPITWMVPEYIEVNQESLDKFNAVYWKDWREYNQAYNDGHVKPYISPWDDVDVTKMVKPNTLVKPLIQVRHITPATTALRKETFREQFTKIVLEAREQHRVVVMNPTIFEGTLDKFQTIEEVFRMLPWLMNVSGYFTELSESDVGKPKKYWNKKQKSWHKVAIVCNELRSIVPSSRLSGEASAGKSKKAIFDIVPEMRHMKCWFLGDYQNPDDLYSGVKHQSNAIVLKNASRNLVGEDMTWIFDSIEKRRLSITKKFYPDAELKTMYWHERDPEFKAYLDDIIPRVDDLPKNQGYVTYPNREFKKEKFELPTFHHKSSLEDFRKDTGITWTINKEMKPKVDTATAGEKRNAGKELKEIKQKVMVMMDEKRKDGLSWKQIHIEVMGMQDKGEIPDLGYANRTPKQLNDSYNNWKSKQTVADAS